MASPVRYLWYCTLLPLVSLLPEQIYVLPAVLVHKLVMRPHRHALPVDLGYVARRGRVVEELRDASEEGFHGRYHHEVEEGFVRAGNVCVCISGLIAVVVGSW